MSIAEILEIVMLVCFGASWPTHLYKTFKSKTTLGKSFLFLFFIDLGYVAGIVSKLCNQAFMNDFANKWYVLIFYCLNFTMVTSDMVLWLIYHNREKKQK